MATKNRGAIFPNPKSAHPDGPIKRCKTCLRVHRSRVTCPDMLVHEETGWKDYGNGLRPVLRMRVNV